MRINILRQASRLSPLRRLICCAALGAFAAFAVSAQHLPSRRAQTAPVLVADTIGVPSDSTLTYVAVEEAGDSAVFIDLVPEAAREKKPASEYDVWVERESSFNPDPTRAVWMSALFPGLGQIYNRRYWKLPIIIGGYLGLAYATSWNNNMLTDYTRAYRDIMDNDPTTNSYMNFFPPTTTESDLDKTWLTNVLQSRKNYFRRNRDLCIIAMVGVYLLAMVDAYVDASLSHFDITPDLSMDVTPAVFQEVRGMKPSVGINWAITF